MSLLLQQKGRLIMSGTFYDPEDVKYGRKYRIHGFGCAASGAWQGKHQGIAEQTGYTAGKHGIRGPLLSIRPDGFNYSGNFSIQEWTNGLRCNITFR